MLQCFGEGQEVQLVVVAVCAVVSRLPLRAGCPVPACQRRLLMAGLRGS